MSKMVQVDELLLERIRNSVIFMDMMFPTRNKYELEITDNLRDDFNALYDGALKSGVRDMKVIIK